MNIGFDLYSPNPPSRSIKGTFMRKLKSIALIISLPLMQSCETTKDSTLLGIGIGSLIGSIAGAASTPDKSNKRALTGAAAGAAIGGLAGYLHKNKESKTVYKNTSELESDIPSLTMPKVRRVWVPDQIQGKKLIKGHFIYVIEKEGRWKVEKK